VKTTRRGLFQTLAAASLPAFPAQSRRLIRVSDVKLPGFVPPVTVLLNGEDVSSRCFRAEQYSDGSGQVYLYQCDAGGRFFLESGRETRGELAREVRSGLVEIIEPKVSHGRLNHLEHYAEGRWQRVEAVRSIDAPRRTDLSVDMTLHRRKQ
jgi:hypothetical protein